MKTRMLNTLLSLTLVVVLAVAVGCSSTKAGSLKSDQTLIRKAAVARLGEAPDMDHYAALVDILQNDPDRIVRSQAALTLGKYSEKYYAIGFCPLSESMQNDPSLFVRAASAVSLSAVRDSRAVVPLIESLRDDARGEVEIALGDKVMVYRACPADAARTSLEKIMGMSFDSAAAVADQKRTEIASQWEDWYDPRAGFFPSPQTAVAKQ
jgi:HEAT repeat protein